MAARRMFSQKIINSARFIKMPVSCQALYFHLGLNADDDGVVEAFGLMRMLGNSEDDIKILVAKGFVQVLNEDLVTYILDWGEHNLIRADRKIDSIYKDLLLKIIPEIKLIESKPRSDHELRSKMYKEGNLPDKFNGVMRSIFYGEKCPACNCMMEEGKTKPSIQHNIPISKGGKHEINNISVICLSCNMSIKNNETDSFNNAVVKEKWQEYLLITSGDSKGTAGGLIEDSIGKDSIGKDSIGKDKTNATKVACVVEFDFNGFSEEEIESIKDWIQYKKESKQTYKPTALKGLRAKLLNLKNKGQLVSSINNSIGNNWAGLFEDKTVTQTFANQEQKQNWDNDSFSEASRRKFAHLMGDNQ